MQFLDPTNPNPDKSLVGTHLSDLRGKRIAYVNNGWLSMTKIGRLVEGPLRDQLGVKEIVYFDVPRNREPPDRLLDLIAQDFDAAAFKERGSMTMPQSSRGRISSCVSMEPSTLGADLGPYSCYFSCRRPSAAARKKVHNVTRSRPHWLERVIPQPLRGSRDTNGSFPAAKCAI